MQVTKCWNNRCEGCVGALDAPLAFNNARKLCSCMDLPICKGGELAFVEIREDKGDRYINLHTRVIEKKEEV